MFDGSYSPAGVVAPRRTPDLLSSYSQEALGMPLARAASGAAIASNNFPGAANVAIFVPFGIAEAKLLVKMWTYNGTAVAGNLDVGVYDTAGNRLVSKGSTAQAGTSAIQEYDVTDTFLVPGLYYMAIASDTSGISQKMFTSPAIAIAGLVRAMGVYQMATAFALPNPATYAVATILQVPYFGLSFRTVL